MHFNTDVLVSCSSVSLSTHTKDRVCRVTNTNIPSTWQQTNKNSLAGKSTEIWLHKKCSHGQRGFILACSYSGCKNNLDTLVLKGILLSSGSHCRKNISTFTWMELFEVLISVHTNTQTRSFLLLLDSLLIHCVEIDSGLWCIIVVSANQITAVHERNPSGLQKRQQTFLSLPFSERDIQGGVKSEKRKTWLHV